MISVIRALVYALLHPGEVRLTVVRRYADAQGRFIGELYEGSGRDARMVGMTCDTMPYLIGDPASVGTSVSCRLEHNLDFTAPMAEGGLRVGAMLPAENEGVRRRIATMRYCPIRISVLNRFVEHVLGQDGIGAQK